MVSVLGISPAVAQNPIEKPTSIAKPVPKPKPKPKAEYEDVASLKPGEKYTWTGEYSSNGLAVVMLSRPYCNKFGYIDRQGKVVIPLTYDYIWCGDEFEHYKKTWQNHQVLMSVSKQPHCKWGYIDQTGKLVVPMVYDWVQGAVYEGDKLLLAKKNGKWGYIDERGNEVIPFIYENGQPFNQNRAAVVKDGKLGFIDRSGKVIIPFQYDYEKGGYFLLGSPVTSVKKGESWGLVDTLGHEVTRFVYSGRSKTISSNGDTNMPVLGGGIAYLDKGGNVYSSDKARKDSSLFKLAEQGFREEQFSLAYRYYQEKDYKQALVWFVKAANQGHPRANAYLGYIFYYAKGVSKDLFAAARYFQEGANGNDDYSMYFLGWMTEHGEGGMTRDTKAAITWYQKSSARGYKLATDRLEALGVSNEPKSAIETFTVKGVSFRMVCVEGGTFTMGATPEQGSEAESNEIPKHNVTLSTFFIGETEVTQALWEAVMGGNPSKFKGDSYPVEQVSWEDIGGKDGTGTDPNCFLYKLNKATGRRFRLPTEAEWEFAARGGNKSKGYKYSGNNGIDSVAWYGHNSGSKTHPVKTKKANELGLYDMSGSVWELCSDWSGSYRGVAQTNPQGLSLGSKRVGRGGGWDAYARYCRVSCRGNFKPDLRHYVLGLRLAL